MVLQDLGRRINAAVTNLTRDQNLDEKVSFLPGAFAPEIATGDVDSGRRS